MTKIDDVVQEAYATATEVNGIRRTLDEFMKTQDQQNERVQKNFDDLFLAIQKITGQPSGELPEDKGSTVKVKNKQVYQQPNPTFRHHRSQIGGPNSVMAGKQFYMPPPDSRARVQFMNQEGPEWSTRATGYDFHHAEYDQMFMEEEMYDCP